MLRPIILSVLLSSGLLACSSSPSPVKPPLTLQPVKNEFSIERVWHKQAGEGASDNYLRLTPVIHGDVMYYIDFHGNVEAYNFKKRTVLWNYAAQTRIGSPLTLFDGVLYFGTSEGEVMALDSHVGTLLWKTQVGSEVIAAPAVSKGYVVARCVNGEIYTLRANDGNKIWSNRQLTPSLTLRGTSSPLIVNDIVLSAYDNGKLLAFNLQTGNILWTRAIALPHGRTTLERLVDIDADIVVSNDVIYTVAFQGKLAALQLGSGQVIWSRDIDSYVGMVIDPYRIYLTDSESRIWALDKSNGATLWKQEALLRRSLTRPQMQSNYIIVGDFNGFLHWLRRDNGKLVARVRLGSFDYDSLNLDESEDLNYPKLNNILATPVESGNLLVAVDRYGNAEAFDIAYP